ncbi:hypothetical protein D3C84_997760 [compost metagenome]
MHQALSGRSAVRRLQPAVLELPGHGVGEVATVFFGVGEAEQIAQRVIGPMACKPGISFQQTIACGAVQRPVRRIEGGQKVADFT